MCLVLLALLGQDYVCCMYLKKILTRSITFTGTKKRIANEYGWYNGEGGCCGGRFCSRFKQFEITLETRSWPSSRSDHEWINTSHQTLPQSSLFPTKALQFCYADVKKRSTIGVCVASNTVFVTLVDPQS